MSRADRGRDQPRAMIHRRILDVAASDPEASMAGIADEVSGASPTLVERVLDEYGDPGRETESDAQDGQSMDASNADATGTGSVNGDDGGQTGLSMSEKQRRTLRALYERPDASQGDLAEELDVTRATISRRLNAIPGFEWADRRDFAESVFGEGDGVESESGSANGSDPNAAESDGGPETPLDAVKSDGVEPDATESGDVELPGAGPGKAESAGTEGDEASADVERGEPRAERESTLADIEARISAIESQMGDGPTEAKQTEAKQTEAKQSIPPELAHKVVHACMESDRLTEDEELAVLQSLME